MQSPGSATSPIAFQNFAHSPSGNKCKTLAYYEHGTPGGRNPRWGSRENILKVNFCCYCHSKPVWSNLGHYAALERFRRMRRASWKEMISIFATSYALREFTDMSSRNFFCGRRTSMAPHMHSKSQGMSHRHLL